MKRFYNDDPDREKQQFFNNDDEDDYDDDEDDDDDVYVDADTISIMNYELSKEDFKHKLLKKAIHVAERSWFWRFRSSISKIKQIAFIYECLVQTIHREEEE